VKKAIAFFDFDGTITTKDTLLEFIRFSKGSFRFRIGFLLNSPYLIAYKLKIISNQSAKEKVLQYFFKGMPVDALNKICAHFTEQKLPQLIRKKALEQIQTYRHQLFDIAVVSASAENWVQPFCTQYGLTCIATKLETKEGKITGKLNGINCKGAEKVCRVKAVFDTSNYEHIIVYGDSTGDTELIALATASFYKPFRV